MSVVPISPPRMRIAVPRAPFSVGLVALLVIANALALHSFLDPTYWPAMLASFAPLALMAMASTPAVLSGGIDLSLSPLLMIVNIVIVHYLLPHAGLDGVLLIPIVLLLGAAIGAIVGTAVAVVRLPPVLVTLAALFVMTGVAQRMLPSPISAKPSWLGHLGDTVGPVPGGLVMVLVPLVAWWAIERTPYGVSIRAVGDSDTAAISAGTNVTLVRLIAYAAGGVLAAIGAISYTALVHSADASNPQQYTVLALAAVALGGTAMTGGHGGLGLSVIGAAAIFLIQNLLNALHVSVFFLNLAYGGALLIAVVAAGRSATQGRRPR